jgi:hypothetical protein
MVPRDGLTLGTKEAMSRAYVYALLAFLASATKVSPLSSDVQDVADRIGRH